MCGSVGCCTIRRYFLTPPFSARANTRPSLGQLRQVGVNKLRDIISGENDEAKEGPAAAPKTSHDAAEEPPGSGTTPSTEEEEKRPHEELNDGGDSATTSSGPTPIPLPPLPPPSPPVEATSDAASMNVQLWELEEQRPAEDCDTSLPPSEENQVSMSVGINSPSVV